MLLFVILSVCLSGVLSAEQTCMPDRFRGQLYDLVTSSHATFYADFRKNRILTVMSEDDFIYFNLTTKMRYVSRNGRCTYAAADPLPRCMPEDTTAKLGWYGLDNGLPVETYKIPSTNGGPTRYLKLEQTIKYPIASGLLGEDGTITNFAIYFRVRRGIRDTSALDSIDLSSCEAEST